MSNLTALNQTMTNANCPSLASGLAYGFMNISGFLLNTTLIIVIVKQTNTSLRAYTDVLITSCGIDLYSSVIQFMTQARPTFQGKNNIYTFSLDGFMAWWLQNLSIFEGGKLNYLLIPEYIGCYFSVTFCCAPFVFRYLAICWNHQMRRWEFASLTFILFSLAVFCSVTINYAAAGVYEINLKAVPVPNPNCTRYLPQFSEGFNNAEKHYQQVFALWSNGTMVILCTYIITLFCFIRIQLFFCCQRGAAANSTQTKIQRQISLTLALQAVVPLLAFYGPQMAFQILLRFGIPWPFAFEILFLCYAAIPVCNSLIVFILIASYRSAFFTLATNLGHQIATTIRLSNYINGPSTTSTQPLFETSNSRAVTKVASKQQNELVVDDF